jgi:hypothetical protein
VIQIALAAGLGQQRAERANDYERPAGAFASQNTAHSGAFCIRYSALVIPYSLFRIRYSVFNPHAS